jgi:UDP-N-acetylglucosamine--N-acetylmuramyl-(pentapeptide) pyrophosphoryl-undecaprenol N-acetylglucosamine transferase
MKFALAGGGTGGHAYPSLAVGAELRARGCELVYYGGAEGPERTLAAAAGIEFRAVPAAQLRGSPRRLLGGGWQLLRGLRVARRLLAADRPGAVFATGGYAAAPVGLAARGAGVPLVVFLPDVRPGWAVRVLARVAARVACSVEASLAALPRERAVVTGYPLRAEFAHATRAEGQARFGLDSALPTLLVAGGSLGARAINATVAAALPRLLARAQLIHVAGRDHEVELAAMREQLAEPARSRYHLLGYTEEMPWAMAAADLAVLRAGASTLGELPAVGLPAILVPGAFSDQEQNARYLEARGAARVLPQAALGALADEALALLADRAELARMSAAVRALARPDATARLATLLQEVAA